MGKRETRILTGLFEDMQAGNNASHTALYYLQIQKNNPVNKLNLAANSWAIAEKLAHILFTNGKFKYA